MEDGGRRGVNEMRRIVEDAENGSMFSVMSHLLLQSRLFYQILPKMYCINA